MKKILLLPLLFVTFFSFGQIVISSTDMPVPTCTYTVWPLHITSPINPALNNNWVVYPFSATYYSEENYSLETDTFFSNQGVDATHIHTKGMSSSVFTLYYEVKRELDFTTTDVKEKGSTVIPKAMDIGYLTGFPGDSIIIPQQKTLDAEYIQTRKFPFTMNSSWHSTSSRQVTNFILKYSPTFDHVPCQHVYYIHRSDTVAGWGKVTLHSSMGPEVTYDVLMDKMSYYTVDSFYVGGVPADATFMSFLNNTQGQRINERHNYEFYREGLYNYLVSCSYGQDSTYNTLFIAFYYDPWASEVSSKNYLFSTVLFPNPVTGGEMNFKIIGRSVHIAKYIVTDIMGRVMLSGNGNNLSELNVNTAELTSGSYILQVSDDKNALLATEHFSVVK